MNDTTNLIKNWSLQIVILTFFVLPMNSYAQDEETPLEISGSADIYYTYDFSGNDNIQTSFADNRNSMSIGMLDVILSKSFKKVSVTGEFSFGPRSFKSIPTFDPGNTGAGQLINLQNLYVSYALTDKLSLTAGYMGTFVGYEVISPAGNFNYSTSYLFSFGPFQNAGIKADYTFSDNFAVMVGLFNDWNVYTDLDGMSDFGAQVYVAPTDGFDIWLNFVTGYTTGTIVDLTTGFQLTEAFYLGLNAADYTAPNSSDGGYSGAALYPQIAISDVFTVGLRAEYFGVKEVVDGEGTVLSAKQSVVSTTLTGKYSMGGFAFIPEIRLDSSDDLGFLDADGAAAGSASQITLAAVYAF